MCMHACGGQRTTLASGTIEPHALRQGISLFWDLQRRVGLAAGEPQGCCHHLSSASIFNGSFGAHIQVLMWQGKHFTELPHLGLRLEILGVREN